MRVLAMDDGAKLDGNMLDHLARDVLFHLLRERTRVTEILQIMLSVQVSIVLQSQLRSPFSFFIFFMP